MSLFVRQTLRPLIVKENSTDLVALRELIESGRVAPVIARTYPLAEAADAIRFVHAGRAAGKVVVTV
jgi:NADPH:quinone reductase-like Zn-dependent oxidoreductase